MKFSGGVLGVAGEVAKHAGNFLYNSGTLKHQTLFNSPARTTSAIMATQNISLLPMAHPIAKLFLRFIVKSFHSRIEFP